MCRVRVVRYCVGALLVCNASLRAQGGWSVADAPRLVVSGAELVQAPVAALYLRGQLVVLDAGARAVRWYDSQGKQSRAVGRRGSGPGEFRSPTWMGRCAKDQLLIWDPPARRLTALSLEGAVLSTARALTAGTSRQPVGIACDSTGSIAFIAAEWPSPTSTSSRLRADIAFLDSDSGPPRLVGSVDGSEFARSETGEWLPMPLGKQPHITSGGGRVFVGSGDSTDIQVFDGGGRRQGSLRLALSERKPSDANLAAAHEELAGPVTGSARAEVLSRLRALPSAKSLPGYTALRADDGGAIWLTLSSAGDDRTRVLVLSGNGVERARLALPPWRTLTDIGSDYLVTIARVPGEEPAVELYTLRRGRP